MRGLPQFRAMPKALFYTYAHRIWEHHLTRCIVRVAYPEAFEQDGKVISGNTRQIVGFIVAEPTNIGLVVHQIYTRLDYNTSKFQWHTYRRQGIAKKLLKSMMDDFGMDKVIYTMEGRTLTKFPAFMDKVYDDWGEWLTYNHCLFWSLLPPKWETGIHATLDPALNKAFREGKLDIPGGTG